MDDDFADIREILQAVRKQGLVRGSLRSDEENDGEGDEELEE